MDYLERTLNEDMDIDGGEEIGSKEADKQILTKKFGKSVGLNADFASDAWQVSDNQYIVDIEDSDEFSIVELSDEGDHENIFDGSLQDVLQFLGIE